MPGAVARQVAAVTPAMGIPASCRIDGLTKMIYAIVMNVVMPARSSVFQLVPSAANSKYRSARSTRGIDGFYRGGGVVIPLSSAGHLNFDIDIAACGM